MKITIDLQDVGKYGLPPNLVYRALYTEYWENLQRCYHNDLWSLVTVCDDAARTLYGHKTGRSKNVKNLILTYSDAETCFQLFKQFADVWAANINAHFSEEDVR